MIFFYNFAKKIRTFNFLNFCICNKLEIKYLIIKIKKK